MVPGAYLEFALEFQFQISCACRLWLWAGAIFNDVTFKMAAWRPYWIFQFPDSNFSLSLNITTELYVEAYLFLAMSLSQWPPGSHVGVFVSGLCRGHGFRSMTRVCFEISNFKLKFHVHVFCGCEQKPVDFQRCHFQNGRLAAI